jgi:hypothetical protein
MCSRVSRSERGMENFSEIPSKAPGALRSALCVFSLAPCALATHDSLKAPKNFSIVFSSTGFVSRLTTTKRITPKIIAHTPL